ncbi:hypothetical protein AB0H57_06925 [Micromonospora sp. NPDC050686]|uniref:hypothetical protein n=1 Tax=Micromonospora sp. NPDC050686 TaxID=3154631 RepID=UPI0033E2A546
MDAYLPRWAVESGVTHADGRGRHAAPDDDDGAAPASGSGWRSGRADRGGVGVPAIGAGPESEHTSEWTFDRPQEQGYVGSRRADQGDGEPVSGAMPTARPRRSSTRRPQVTWSGGDEPDAGAEPGRRTRRGRRALEAGPAVDPWSRSAEPEPAQPPAVDPWSRSAEAEPEQPPAVDPWDASGVRAWQGSGGDRWDRSGAAGRWDQGDSTGQWDKFTDTAEWDGAGRWDRPGGRGRAGETGWDGAGADRWDAAAAEGPDRAQAARWGGTARAEPVEPTTGWPWREQAERFWSGTRLAGDDPRWVDAPPSAPRSPAVAYSAARPRVAPRRSAMDRAGGSVDSGSWRQRIDSVGGGVWGRRLEDDLLDPDPGGPLRPLVYTAACYLVPAVLVFLWLLTLDGQAPAGCVTDISGGGCDSPRAHAVGSLIAGAPRFGLALLGSLVVAVVLRRVGTTWRSTTVALAAAVVGGGLSTVLISAVTGQPIG